MDTIERRMRTELQWAGRVLVFAAVMCSALPLDAGQPPSPEAAARPPAQREAPPVNLDGQSAQTRRGLEADSEQDAPLDRRSVPAPTRRCSATRRTWRHIPRSPHSCSAIRKWRTTPRTSSAASGSTTGSQTRRARAIDVWRDVSQALVIFSVFLVVTGVLTWLVRTLIEYRRWLRLSRIQTEVHTKLLDRLTSNEDLLAYIQSPSGRKFLESAPIPVDSGRVRSARPWGASCGRSRRGSSWPPAASACSTSAETRSRTSLQLSTPSVFWPLPLAPGSSSRPESRIFSRSGWGCWTPTRGPRNEGLRADRPVCP